MEVNQEDFPVIFSYTRQEAIEDGVLVDVTPLAKQNGIRLHTVLTAALYQKIMPSFDDFQSGQTLEGRLFDLFTVFAFKARDVSDDSFLFKFIVSIDDKPTRIEVKAHIGPGDTPAPVLTFMLPDED